MAYYRRRRYAMKPRRSRRLSKKRRTMAILKKDIRKCNFPNKVKFLGMTEKKVMFLRYEPTAAITSSKWCFYLDPTNTKNISTLRTEYTFTKGTAKALGYLTNWDKFCVLGIYIRLQPVANVYNGTDGQKIQQIKCTYTMNNIEVGSSDDANILDLTADGLYDSANINNKQVFTFNSNESFTLYVPAPTTMCYNSPVVHKSKTWWSLSELKPIAANSRRGDNDSFSEDYEDVEGVLAVDQFSMHCGRLYLEATNPINYNVTINYKVALKG